ncbi:MAG TPA: Coq4 family protein [Nostoc sp.]|uniref:Coq4 family protein n=1 Tax=Nostoc sp. TaxID=1180 RepID=UPI002D60B1B8|nr:Coq4 family protein [Nostoc sp.]HYX13548.1 Coq4 family protein [Nostoc sp.]
MIETINQSQETAILESFVELVKSPYGDFVTIGKLSHVLNEPATLQKIVAFLTLTPQGKQAFVDRPLLGKIDLQQLHQLPNHTLGYLYADHMITKGLTPPPVNEIANNPFTFLGVHIGETHDIWHVVTGCDTDKPGEVKLEAFYTAQLVPDRLFLALLAKNLLKTAMYEVELCEQILDGLTQGWIMGKRAKPLFGIEWNRLWETPLEEVQTSLNIAPI